MRRKHAKSERGVRLERTANAKALGQEYAWVFKEQEESQCGRSSESEGQWERPGEEGGKGQVLLGLTAMVTRLYSNGNRKPQDGF